MAEPLRLGVLGYFPPTATGQAIATERLCDLLSNDFSVARVPLPGGTAGRRLRQRVADQGQLLMRRSRIGEVLEHQDLVLWTSISPTTLGHLRDRQVFRHLSPTRTIGCVHWGQFGQILGGAGRKSSLRQLCVKLAALVYLEPSLFPDQFSTSNQRAIPNAIPQGFRLEEEGRRRIQELRRLRLVERRSVRLIFVGMLSPDKGLVRALDVLDELQSRGVSAKLELVGGWESEAVRRDLEKRVAGDDRVSMTGSIPAAEVGDRLDQADVMLFPTTYWAEAQPLVVLEAMARGLPIATTRWRALPDMVGHDSPGLADVDIRSLTDAVQRLIQPDLSVTESLRLSARLADRYSEAVVRGHWRSLVEECHARAQG